MRENNLGIQGYSASTGGEQYIVFSSYSERKEVIHYLSEQNISFKEVIGSYKEELEMSYIINVEDFDTLTASELLADQDSVMHLGPAQQQTKREAHLYYMSDNGAVVVDVESLGLIRSCTQEEAYQGDSWTFCPTLNTFFITEQGNDD